MNKCVGCGITLQFVNKEELGFTNNIESKICERCFRLKNYGEYKTVNLTNKDYEQIIKNIKDDSLIVYVADLLSLDLSRMPKNKNILLVLTKYDILPKSTNESKLISKLKEIYPKVLDVIAVSSLKNYNIDKFYNLLNKYSNNRDVYLIGNTNCGKSTLLNKLIKNYNDDKTTSVTVSMYPSTTLDILEIKLNDLIIIDTPGLIDEGSYTNILNSKDLKKITPKKEIKPKSCQVTGEGSIIIDSFARIDYETNESNSFVIYTSSLVESKFISQKNNTYKDFLAYKYSLSNNQDIVLPGLGFIKFTKPINITIYVPNKIKPYTRNNLI